MNDNGFYKDLFNIMQLRSAVSADTSIREYECIINSLHYKKNLLLSNTWGEKIGYVIWADINREAAERFLFFDIEPAFHYEWHEGNIKLILDFRFNPRWKFYALSQLKAFIKSNRVVLYKKKERKKLYIRSKGIFTNN